MFVDEMGLAIVCDLEVVTVVYLACKSGLEMIMYGLSQLVTGNTTTNIQSLGHLVFQLVDDLLAVLRDLLIHVDCHCVICFGFNEILNHLDGLLARNLTYQVNGSLL